MSHENQLVNLASHNTQYSPLITFILCCARKGMGVYMKVVSHHTSGKTVKLIDGNCIEASDHRLQELRTIAAGALPGKSLVIYDPVLRIDTLALSELFPRVFEEDTLSRCFEFILA
jgi:hypothetical protein